MSKTLQKRVIIALLIGFFVGVFWFIAVRFALYEKKEVHYHANFALYVNGEKENFESFAFYEEVQSCSSEAAFNPNIRTHMHDEVNHVVHVHDEGATWGHLFANLGFTLGNEVIQTDEGIYINSEDDELRFILNGEEVSSIANQAIRSEDVLLISYGDESEDELDQRYEEITKDAAEYNERQDPSACSGGKPATFTERLKAASGFQD